MSRAAVVVLLALATLVSATLIEFDLSSPSYPLGFSDNSGCRRAPVYQPLSSLPAAAVQDALREAEIAIETVRQRRGTVGIAAGVVYGQDLIWTKGFGFKDAAARTPVDADTIFRIASISKVFTTVQFLDFVEQVCLLLQSLLLPY